MTRYEFLDFTNSSVMVFTLCAFDYISVFFAYVVCGYLVRTKISRLQAITLTAAYTIYLAFNILTLVASINRLIDAAVKQGNEVDMVSRLDAMVIAGPGLLAFIWICSVVYMFGNDRGANGQTGGGV